MKRRFFHLVICCLALTMPSSLFAFVHVQVHSNGLMYAGVMVNGPTAGKYNIVFVGDGFTSSTADQNKFNQAVSDAVNAMSHKQPYQGQLCSFNVWRVNVISSESGIDHPKSAIAKNTELDCTFGDDISQPERVIYSTDESKVFEAANYAPKHDAVYVLVNDTEYGGASGSVVYTSLNTSMQEVIVHELGHFVGKLADEYTCRFCDGRAEPVYSGPEPQAANVTIETNRNLIKWHNLINAATPVPTTIDNPVGVVGLWAGGVYSPTGVYHPQLNCLMRILNVGLCQVCSNELTRILNPYCTYCQRHPNSLICLVADLRHKVLLNGWPIRLKIPLCCFCPLDDHQREAEVELSVNPEDYTVELTDGSNNRIPSETRRGSNGGIIISYREKGNQHYYLDLTPRTATKAVQEINASLKRDGESSVLF